MNNSKPTFTDILLWDYLPIWDLVPVFSISTCKYLEVPLKPSPLQAEQHQIPCMARQEDKKQHIQDKSRVSYWIEIKTFSLWGQSAIGRGCPETQCSLCLGRFLRHCCITHWETPSDFTLTQLWAGGSGLEISWGTFKPQLPHDPTNSRSNTLWKWEAARESH